MHKKIIGFTLIEVLIALLVIAIALTAVIRTTHSSIYAISHTKQQLTAHWVGMNILSEIQTGLLSVPVDEAHINGQTQMMNAVWDWTAEIDHSLSMPFAQCIVITVYLDHRKITSVYGFMHHES